MSGPPPDFTLEEAARLTAGAEMWASAALPHQGVPALHMADGPMGMASVRVDERDVALLMPCGTALAASWDVDLAGRIGALVASECTRLGRQAVLGPNLNLPRSPLAGRAFETYSEDPLLSGEIGAAWIGGVQAGGVSAVAKHVVGNDSETQRHRMNSVMDVRTLREVYLRPFERAARAGVGGMLMAYNRLNGVPCAEQTQVIRLLRNELHFTGVLMSDWFGVQNGAKSLQAGLDLEMPGPGRQMGEHAAQLARSGEVSEARVQAAARSVAAWATAWQTPVPAAQDAAELLTEAAAASFVLLKNDRGVLPLAPQRPLAVIGPNAATPCYQGATFARIALSDDVQTPLSALEQRFAVEHEVGVEPEYRLPPLPALPITAATGEPGLTVTYHAGGPDRPAVFSEVRRTSTLVWFAQDMPAGLSTHQGATVRARTTLTPERGGRYTLYYGGTGDVTLRVDGVEWGHQPSPVVGGDVMGHLLRGEATSVHLQLEAGVPVQLEYEMTYRPARAQGLWFGARPPAQPDLMRRAEALAARSAQVVLVVGETADSGVESRDRTTTRLPDRQLQLIERVCAANPQTVVVVNAAHAVDTSWAAQAAAVLQVWFPGQAFGPALAEVLSGIREPGGRLPVTFAAQEADYPAFDLTPDEHADLHYQEGVLIGYRSLAAQGVAPAYPLGHGLGYATFYYGDVQLASGPDGEVTLTVPVTNTSARRGKAVVQAYVAQPAFEDVPAHPALAGFTALEVPAGATQHARVTLTRDALRRWSEAAGGWVEPAERRSLQVGTSLADIFWQGTLPR
ncbi:beta-glucosidase [Deinococcus sonorensis]|uniref:Glycoside hydrolase family 3 C-terminal domain-containing protein n=2 Tax=Deinococcus sonorensis TaxID=309891 RepID=A0AAU7U578_9DEIO